jgi:serine/threonine-protein kinase
MLCLQVLEGLEAAHQKGIVHRDMKPANVFVIRKTDEQRTEKDFVKLLDFGISKMQAEGSTRGLTMTGMAMGTPSYMAPEQFFDARSVDQRADVYSVAVMMYELLAGRLPIEATSYADLIVKVRTEVPPHLSLVAADVPKPLADAVMVGLAKEKENRWASAWEFAQGLRAALSHGLPNQTPPPALAPVGPLPPLEVKSMGLGKTAPPQRATPLGAPAPALLASPRLLSERSAPAPPGRSGTSPGLKWVLILTGLGTLGCCLCSSVWLSVNAENQRASNEVMPSPLADDEGLDELPSGPELLTRAENKGVTFTEAEASRLLVVLERVHGLVEKMKQSPLSVAESRELKELRHELERFTRNKGR